MIDRVGERFGNYRLLRLLGTGGFAQVYLGEHLYLHTQAAIKVLHTQLAPQDLELFQREARTVAHLLHPSIVRVLEFGVEGTLPFLVMDHAPGGTLRQQHPKGVALPPLHLLPYLKQMAAALQYAHEQKVVHRDVKPENMLVGRQQEILLSDFGIAFVAQTSLQQSIDQMAGTIAYMAPEQLNGRPHPASDQYSLGVVVYEWLCGQRPFSGTFTEIAIKHRIMPPPSLRQAVPALSAEIEQVVMTALAKDPTGRFATVTAFATAFEQACHGQSGHMARHSAITPILPLWPPSHEVDVDFAIPPSRPDTPQVSSREHTPLPLGNSFAPDSTYTSVTSADSTIPQQVQQHRYSRRMLVVGLVGLGAVSVTSGLTWFMVSSRQQQSQPTPSKPKLGTTLATYTGHIYPVYSASWSPDGRYIASGGNDTTVQIWNPANGNQLFAFRGHKASVGVVAWSPDLQKPHIIASAGADQTVQVWDFDSQKVLLTYREHVSDVRAMAWSPDGTRIASGDAKGNIRIWNVATGRLLLSHDSHTRLWTLAWSPNGQWIASGGDSGVIEVWNTTTGKARALYTGHSRAHFIKSVAWSPDGQLIASGSDDWTVQVWNSMSAETLTTYRGHFEVLNTIAWSPDGKYIASGSGDHTVQLWLHTSGKMIYSYHGHTLALHAVPWSPDGTRIASASDDTYVKVWQAI